MEPQIRKINLLEKSNSLSYLLILMSKRFLCSEFTYTLPIKNVFISERFYSAEVKE